jgi:uncharacterized protein YqeY
MIGARCSRLHEISVPSCSFRIFRSKMAAMKTHLKEALKVAMKAQNRLKMETIRSLLSEIQYEEMQKGLNDLPEADCGLVLQREVKKRHEAISFEEQAGRQDAKEKLVNEIAIIEEFLPKQLSIEAIEKILTDYKTSTAGAVMGTAMKFLKERYPGQYDGKSASEIAKKVFT